jgi:hypothetical protein
VAFRVERRDPASIGLAREVLERWLQAIGPVAFVDLETTGLPESRSAEILEIGIVLLEPGTPDVGVARSLVRPARPIPPLVRRLTGISEEDAESAPPLAAIRDDVRDLLSDRRLVAHQVDFERAFLARDVDATLGAERFLDTQEILSLTHPDAPDALDVARMLGRLAQGAASGEARYRRAGQILYRRLPGSPWQALLEPGAPAVSAPGDFAAFARARFASSSASDGSESHDAVREVAEESFLHIGESEEEPVPFELEAIALALADGERGRRHFPGYRVRAEQLELAREFVVVLRDGGVAKLEGGTGVGKSLAYLAAAIPFAMERARAGEREPVLISTRTKLLQDQLLRNDIAAAARFLGYPELRALSIKGRANYVCERRLTASLSEAEDPALLDDLRADYAMLEACARIRPHGEVGTVPAALLRRHPRLRELLRASVAITTSCCAGRPTIRDSRTRSWTRATRWVASPRRSTRCARGRRRSPSGSTSSSVLRREGGGAAARAGASRRRPPPSSRRGPCVRIAVT